MRRLRKKRPEEQEEHRDETWLIPYADLLTLLLALFIVLFAASNINKSKYETIMESFKDELTGSKIDHTQGRFLYSTSSHKPVNTQPVENQRDSKLENLTEKLSDYINQNDLQAMITLKYSNRGVEITLKDDILFDPGKADLKESSFHTLDTISGLIKTVQNSISIEGYTDNVPIGNAAFASNWELSAARAASVLHYFESMEIAGQRLQFTGFGEFKPLYPNDTAAHRAANRRVDIVILRSS